MQPVLQLVIIIIATAEIYGDGSHALSLTKIIQKKDWWRSFRFRPLPKKEIPVDLIRGLYRILNQYPQMSSFRKDPERIQGLPIVATIIGKGRNGRTKIGRRKLAAGIDAISQNDDHAVKSRALFPSLLCPSDTIKLHGQCKNIPKSYYLDYDDYSQILGSYN